MTALLLRGQLAVREAPAAAQQLAEGQGVPVADRAPEVLAPGDARWLQRGGLGALERRRRLFPVVLAVGHQGIPVAGILPDGRCGQGRLR